MLQQSFFNLGVHSKCSKISKAKEAKTNSIDPDMTVSEAAVYQAILTSILSISALKTNSLFENRKVFENLQNCVLNMVQ